MLDTINQENSKVVITTVVPGVIAVFPFAAIIITELVAPQYLKDSVLTFATIAFVISIAIGLILENIGSFIENIWASLYSYRLTMAKSKIEPITAAPQGSHIQRLFNWFMELVKPIVAASSITDDQKYKKGDATVATFYDYNEVWRHYLSIKIDKDNAPTIYGYYGSIITRMKFELSLIPALIICYLGLIFICYYIDIKLLFRHFWFWTTAIFIVLLVSHIIFSYQSVQYLHKLRLRMLQS